MKVAEAERVCRASVFDAVCVAALVAYFLHFALPAVRGVFREDEMMNMWIYWRAGALKSLFANVMFWTTFYRPAGALYYLPLYQLFGLDPLPYRIVQIVILAASIPMLYYLSYYLSWSRSVAFLATLASCYHPRLAELVFVGSFIYDVLCGFFYFAALSYYIRIRQQNASLKPLQLLEFLALYVCALNSKEMAVTLPVIVLIYEFLRCPRLASWKAFFHWTWSVAGPSLIAGLLTAIYVYGKTQGSGSLTRYDTYRPKVSWHHFVASNTTFVSELLYSQHVITPITLLALWAIVFIYAFLHRDRMLQLMAFWIVIVPLPLAFLIPVRAGPCLYLVLFGWAMIFAKAALDLITLFSTSWSLVRQRVRMGTCSGIVRTAVASGPRPGTAVNKMSPQVFRSVATLLMASAVAIFTQWDNQRNNVVPALLGLGQKGSHVIETLKSLHFQPASRSTVLLKMPENPFPNKWHAVFIAYLVWNDHSLRIWLEGVNQLTPRQLASVDYIISLSEFKAQLIRAPEMPQSGH